MPKADAVYVSRGHSSARKLLSDVAAAITPTLQLTLSGALNAIRERGGTSFGDVKVEIAPNKAGQEKVCARCTTLYHYHYCAYLFRSPSRMVLHTGAHRQPVAKQ